MLGGGFSRALARLRLTAATSLLPSKFVVIPLRLQSAAARPKHEIYTDISNKGTGTTTIAGVLNPSGDGRAQDAFSFTLNHTSIPLQFGSASFLVRPGNTAAMEAYAMVFALALWRNKLRGGDVTCMSDCRAVVDSAEKRVLPAGPVKLPVTDVELNRAAFAAVGPAMRELAEDADLNLEFRWITGDRNKLADVLSKCTTQGRRDRLHPEVLQQVEATGKRLSEIKLEGLVGVLGVMLPGAVAKGRLCSLVVSIRIKADMRSSCQNSGASAGQPRYRRPSARFGGCGGACSASPDGHRGV